MARKENKFPKHVVVETLLDHEMTSFSLRPLAPFRLDLTAWALRRRPGNSIDRWDGETYRRVLAIADKPILVAVIQQGATLRVSVAGEDISSEDRQNTKLALERLLGIRVDLSEFYECTSRYPRLGHLAAAFRGLKPPRFATVFEGLVNGISCQQLSLTVGIVFLNRLAERCGLKFRRACTLSLDRKIWSICIPKTFAGLGIAATKLDRLLEPRGQSSRDISIWKGLLKWTIRNALSASTQYRE